LMEYPSDQCNTHTPRVALPFLKITLNAPKPKPAHYPANPKTLGEHIRKKRMDLRLLQREVAEIIGVNACTIHNWECSHLRPNALYIPRIIAFLERHPFVKDNETGSHKLLETHSEHLFNSSIG
jgi:DNA-binding transcriptional regulator YiaG